MSVPRPASHGTPLQLKGLSQALPCLCFDRDLSRHVVGEKVRFNTLNRATGNRLKRQMVDAVTGDIVESDEQVKGYAVGKDQYVTVEDDELANVAIESTHTVEIEKFVPKASIDDRYRDTPYYLAPEDKVGQEAFAVIRDAMKKKKMVGIGRVVMARRERAMMLEAFGKGIMGTTLHYPYEIRSDEAVFEEIPELKLPDQMVGLAEDIIDKMSGEFEPDKFEDRYENAMIELIRSKQAGLPAPKEKPAAQPQNVVNLMDALRKSIEESGGKPKPAKGGKRGPVEAVPAKKRKKAG
jgi:DNA end-binding protein Ku